QALASLDQAIALKSDYPEAFNNRGSVFRDLNRLEEALSSYNEALRLKPDYADAMGNRGVALAELGRTEDTIESFEQAVSLAPGNAALRFALCMSELPVLYMNEDEIVKRRNAYEKRLRALCELNDARITSAELANGVGTNQPFYLTYQGHNDRELQ